MTRCVFVVLVIMVGIVSSADVFTPEQLQKLDEYIDSVMSCWNIPGLSLAVVQGDSVFTRAYGKTDLDKGTSATPDSIFCIGSVTKAMTSALLSKLVPVKFPETVWDTKLTDILGESFKLAAEGTAESATLKDILCHRTGKSRADVSLFAGRPNNVTRAEISKRLYMLPAFAPFRYEFGYNNYMYLLAGHIAEVLGGGDVTWEDLMRKHLFQRLRMDSTIFVQDLKNQPESKLALPYFEIDGTNRRASFDLFRIHPGEPAGGVCSTGNDMSKWLQFLLQTGTSPAVNDIVDAKAFGETMQPYESINAYPSDLYLPTFPVDNVIIGYGFGWITSVYRGRHQVNHGGVLLMHTSLLWLYPELKSGIFLTINGQKDGGDGKIPIMYYISDLLLGEEPWLNSTTACTFPKPWREPPSAPSTPNATSDFTYRTQRPLDQYTGIYGHRLYGEIHVSINSSANALHIQLGINMEGLLIPTEEKDVFSWETIGLYWFFPRDVSKHDRFHFYGKDDDNIDMLNVTIITDAMNFDRNVRFMGVLSGAMRPLSRLLSILFALFVFL